SATPLIAQSGTIAGTIIDAESSAAGGGAILILDSGERTVVSGADGRSTLAPVPAGQHLTQVQRIGYEPVAPSATVPDGGTTIVDVSLVPAPLALDEIVVSGAAGGRRRREVGNVVTRLEIDDLTDRPATVSDFLQGAAAGIEVTGGSGEAGQ